jgi:hypothetical protein
MTIQWLAVILAGLAACSISFIWLLVSLHRLQGGRSKFGATDSYDKLAEEETSHLFNKEFREELRNRGRLRFETIIEENAMFLQQDLRLTTSQLNEYMKEQISQKLDSEFDAYAKAMQDLQELAKASLQQAADKVEKQRAEFAETLEKDIEHRKQAMLQAFEENMAAVIEHYAAEALGKQFDLQSQLPYIIEQMKASKQDMVEDMKL